MIRKFFLLNVILMASLMGFSQNYIYRGEQQIPATETWTFETSKDAGSIINVTVGKSKAAAYLMLAAGVPAEHFVIAGSVILYLENGKVLTLSKKLVTDHLDGNCQVLYSIPMISFVQLKEHNIVRIRYSIVETWTKTRRNYTATNTDNVLDHMYGVSPSKPLTFQTATAISEL